MAGVKASLDPRKAENIFYPPDLRIATPLTSQATTVPKVPPIAQPVDKDPATTSTAKVSTATQPTNMGTTKTTFEPTQASTEKEAFLGKEATSKTTSGPSKAPKEKQVSQLKEIEQCTDMARTDRNVKVCHLINPPP